MQNNQKKTNMMTQNSNLLFSEILKHLQIVVNELRVGFNNVHLKSCLQIPDSCAIEVSTYSRQFFHCGK